MAKIASATEPIDEMTEKGATEDDGRDPKPVTSPDGQLGHRDQDEMLKDNDTDFPEPDAEAEITGR